MKELTNYEVNKGPLDTMRYDTIRPNFLTSTERRLRRGGTSHLHCSAVRVSGHSVHYSDYSTSTLLLNIRVASASGFSFFLLEAVLCTNARHESRN